MSDMHGFATVVNVKSLNTFIIYMVMKVYFRDFKQVVMFDLDEYG